MNFSAGRLSSNKNMLQPFGNHRCQWHIPAIRILTTHGMTQNFYDPILSFRLSFFDFLRCNIILRKSGRFPGLMICF